MSSYSPESVHIHIEPTRGWVSLKLGELWEYRELLYFLTWRNLKIRYKQTALGAVWAVLQPVSSMLIFTLFFGKLAKMPSDGIPYPLFSYAALLPWNYFSGSLTRSTSSLVGSANLITRVYFPRLVIPISGVMSGLVDFAIAFSVLLLMMWYYGVSPTAATWLLPFFLLLALVTALGVGMWFSALNVRYRDVGFVIPFLTHFWMFATPVVYPSSLLHQPWQTVYGINPMVGVVEGFRWALVGTHPPSAMIGVSAAVSVLILVTGVFYFRRVEKTFADVV